MSDMLDAILRMPIQLWSDSHLDQLQRHGRYIEAANLIQILTDERDALQSKLDSGVRVEIMVDHLPLIGRTQTALFNSETPNATLILDEVNERTKTI